MPLTYGVSFATYDTNASFKIILRLYIWNEKIYEI